MTTSIFDRLSLSPPHQAACRPVECISVHSPSRNSVGRGERIFLERFLQPRLASVESLHDSFPRREKTKKAGTETPKTKAKGSFLIITPKTKSKESFVFNGDEDEGALDLCIASTLSLRANRRRADVDRSNQLAALQDVAHPSFLNGVVEIQTQGLERREVGTQMAGSMKSDKSVESCVCMISLGIYCRI